MDWDWRDEADFAKELVAAEIATKIISKDFTRGDLAGALGCSRQRVFQILGGDQNFTIETLARICAAPNGGHQFIVRILGPDEACFPFPLDRIDAVRTAAFGKGPEELAS